MNRLRDIDEDIAAPEDREISLGVPTILGIFFTLALVCAGFFAFGYSLGRRSLQSATAVTASDTGLAASNASKPAAGSPAAQPDASPAGTPPATVVPTAATPSPTAPAATPAVIVADKPAPAAPQPATANPQPSASFVVQVAAVSTQDIADILTASLEKKGYRVTVHPEPDKLLHVQIGPFADRKDAEAMRTRVLADGFNAIVK